MSLQEPIQSIFEENTNYETARQLVNQAASLKYLSSDLYRDSKRFVYELLQNADDSAIGDSKVKVAIKLFGDKLVVAHTGKAFDARDLRGITGVDDGTKKMQSIRPGLKASALKRYLDSPTMLLYFLRENISGSMRRRHIHGKINGAIARKHGNIKMGASSRCPGSSFRF